MGFIVVKTVHIPGCFSGWFFASAKDNINIEESSKYLVQKIIDNDKWSAHGARVNNRHTDGPAINLHQGGKRQAHSLDPPKDKCSC